MRSTIASKKSPADSFDRPVSTVGFQLYVEHPSLDYIWRIGFPVFKFIRTVAKISLALTLALFTPSSDGWGRGPRSEL